MGRGSKKFLPSTLFMGMVGAVQAAKIASGEGGAIHAADVERAAMDVIKKVEKARLVTVMPMGHMTASQRGKHAWAIRRENKQRAIRGLPPVGNVAARARQVAVRKAARAQARKQKAKKISAKKRKANAKKAAVKRWDSYYKETPKKEPAKRRKMRLQRERRAKKKNPPKRKRQYVGDFKGGGVGYQPGFQGPGA